MDVSLEFDDVLIRPVVSSVNSRDSVDISVKLSDSLTLDFPLIASPMVGVVDGKFAHLLSKLGGLAIFHRFYKSRHLLFEDMKNLSPDDKFGLSVKVGEEKFEEYLEYHPDILLIDTANGYTNSLREYCETLKNYIVSNGFTTLLMAGNVATQAGCKKLADYGCDIVRVGIGGGSPCSTRNQTGVGVPTISALLECGQQVGYKTIVDGGIKNSGDFVKAIVAGADLGMAGKLYAECYESPNEGILYGMASRTHMENTKAEIKSVEGFDTPITKKQSLAQFVREFGYGIKSAGTYLNSKNLEDMYVNGAFTFVTDSAIKKGI